MASVEAVTTAVALVWPIADGDMAMLTALLVTAAAAGMIQVGKPAMALLLASARKPAPGSHFGGWTEGGRGFGVWGRVAA
jgi:hypothetical protein